MQFGCASIFFVLVECFSLTENNSLTECTECTETPWLRDDFARYSRRARTLRCSRFCCSLFFFRSFFSHGIHGTHGIFLFQNSLFDFVKCARRNARKFIAARWFLSTNFINFMNIYCYAIIFLLRFISVLFFYSLFCCAKIALWICTDFFGLATERTHEPCVPTRGYCVCEYFFVIL